MRRLILLAFIGVLLMKNAAPSNNQKYPSRLAWLFGMNNKINENKNENKDKNNEEKKPTVCQSQECKKIARIISESMDKSIDPCDDFYEYACGKWPEHNPSPKGLDSWNMLKKTQTKVMEQIKEILDEGPKNDDVLAVKLAKKWYAACMDTDAMDRQGLEPLVFTISRIGGWPMIMDPDEWNEQEYSWQKVDDQYVRLMGRNVFHDVRVRIKYGLDGTPKVTHIDIPHLPPGSYNKLWNRADNSEEKKDESNEDPSDEERQSNEQQDSQEPGSEGKDDDKDDNNNKKDDNEDDNNDDNKDDNKHDDNDDDEDDDKNDDTYEQDDDINAKKKIGKKKTKLAKNKKLRHSKKTKIGTHSEKYGSHKMKKERVIKRRIISTNVREKLRARKNERNHARKTRRERLKETLEATTPQMSSEEMTNEDNVVKEYADYISKVARAMAKARGIEVSEEHMDKDIQDMIDFQIKLVDIVKSAEYGKYEELTLNDFQQKYDEGNPQTANSAINWMYKIGELFDEAHVPVGGDADLEIGSLDYFKSLVALLDETSSRTIVNYIHWNFLSRIIVTTTKEMRELYDTWVENKENSDVEEVFGLKRRLLKCTKEAGMSAITAYEYVRRHFSDEIKTAASDMIDDIQKEVEYQIKESDWMDEDTQDFVLAKLVNMKKYIGYPDWYRNNTIVKRYFQGLNIGNSYYENTLSYDRYSKWKKLRELMKEDEDDDIYSIRLDPIVVNALFSPHHNSIALSAADFQSPWFAYGRPQAINYGIVGSMMAHEVNHGFDNRGHLFDKNGEIVEWLSAMAEAYGKRAECFVEQFNNYPIDKATNYKIKNYGNQTVGENIADTMGLEAAFKAYRRRERECGKPDAVLAGLEDLTNDQLYFLSFANLCCENAETNDTIKNAKIDVHSSGRLRVIGSVSNSQDFAKAFNCPVGSAMNPERKCHIWK